MYSIDFGALACCGMELRVIITRSNRNKARVRIYWEHTVVRR